MLKEIAIEIFDVKWRICFKHNLMAENLQQNFQLPIIAHATKVGDLSNEIWIKDRTAPDDSDMRMYAWQWAEYMSMPLCTKPELLTWLAKVHNLDLRDNNG